MKSLTNHELIDVATLLMKLNDRHKNPILQDVARILMVAAKADNPERVIRTNLAKLTYNNNKIKLNTLDEDEQSLLLWEAKWNESFSCPFPLQLSF
jgi:hypothetical protein